MIARYDRKRTLTVQANPALGVTFPTLYADVKDKIEALALPPGYSVEWGGEQENSSKSQASLLPGAVPALASRFRDGATYPIPCVRLTKAECRVLVDAITDFGQSMPKTTKARKLADLLASSVCVY